MLNSLDFLISREIQKKYQCNMDAREIVFVNIISNRSYTSKLESMQHISKEKNSYTYHLKSY